MGTWRMRAVWKLLHLLVAATLLAACGSEVSPTGASASGSVESSNGGGTTSSTTGSATLTWVAPVQNTDGSILNDLSGYTIYYGTNSAALTETIQITNSAQTTYVINNLSAGTYYFSVAANASDGTQSSQSTVVTKTIM
jgi:hypothetical protein